jgi:predicted AlkP superfamily phosphohydrolase/phosphomutase
MAYRHDARKRRLLFIGLDAADAQLIERWCQEGRLPNISQMKARGTWCRLNTTAEIFHVSAWPSIFTGTTPDKHGLYHAYVIHPGHQGVLRPRPDQSPVPFLWKLLSDHGSRSVIMDAFLTCPLQDFNGTQIVDWGTWSWFWDPTTTPVSLKKAIQKRFGPYPSEDHSKVGITPLTDVAGFRSRLLAAVAKKTEVVKWLIAKEDWEFFLVVFGESHPAGHYFWHLHDPSYITHPKEGAGALRDALRDVYVALDNAIGQLLQSVDGDTTVMLVSGDGMAGNYSGSHLLTDVLVRMGALKGTGVTPDGEPRGSSEGGPDTRGDLLSTVRNMIPQRLRIAISDALLTREMKEQLSLRWKTAGIAWSQTRAFVIENANEGYIRINLRGREPQGTVAPGRQYGELCEEIYKTAKAMTHPETGKPAARAVYKTDDLYNGPCRSQMPDVVITWNIDAKVTTELLVDKYGLVRVQNPSCGTPPFYTGNHWPNAFTVVIGPDVPRGLVLEGRHILDLAPTILSRFGIEPPDSMDGKVLSELHSEATQA